MRALALLLLLGCPGPGKDSNGGGRDSAQDSGGGDDTDTAAENAAPSAPVVAITPAAPSPENDLTVTVVTPSVDAENDAVTYRYAWAVDGAARAELTAETVAAAETEDGQTWTVTVTPNDGVLDGEPGVSSVTIGNAPPTPPTVHIDPAAPVAGDALTLVFDTDASDENGDTLTQAITWYVDGSRNGSWDDRTEVEGRYVDGGETYLAVVSVTDGLSDPVTAEATVTVANTAPVIRSVAITPTSPRDGDDLRASVSAIDPDGGTLAYSYAWTRDGVAAADVGDADTVPAELTTVGETWGLTVVVSDGADDESGSAADVEIADSDKVMLNQRLTAYIPADGATATGSWEATLYTSGAKFGANDCDLTWDIDAASNPRICPRCDWSFGADYPLASVTTRSAGMYCNLFTGDGVGTMQGSLAGPELQAENEVTSTYYGYSGYGLYVYAFGPSGGYGYSGYGYTFSRYYGVTAVEDTAGNTTIEAYTYIYQAY